MDTNRSWFVRGPALSHSRTVYERVSALVSLAASSTSSDTRHPVVFSGHVTPNHAGNRVLLQYNTNGDDWRTLKSGVVGPDSNYSISAAFRTPGERNLRVLLPRDPRNVASASDPVTVLTQQTEHSDFTINTSDPIVTNLAPYTISGTLDQPGTTTPEPNTSVSLFAREPGTKGAHLVTTTTHRRVGQLRVREPQLDDQRAVPGADHLRPRAGRQRGPVRGRPGRRLDERELLDLHGRRVRSRSAATSPRTSPATSSTCSASALTVTGTRSRCATCTPARCSSSAGPSGPRAPSSSGPASSAGPPTSAPPRLRSPSR